MTKTDFLSKIPYVIEHRTNGLSKLEIIVDNSKTKGVCYKNDEKASSCGTYGSSWLEIYNDLNKHLSEQGYLKPIYL